MVRVLVVDDNLLRSAVGTNSTKGIPMRAISALVIGFSLAVASANAAPTLQINSDGLLTGALNVDVGGTPYNVQFLDGTCATVFGSCIGSSYTFHNAMDALTAAQALLDQAFIDTGSILTHI